MSIAHNTMSLRGTPARRWKFTEGEILLRQETLRLGGRMPSWYYDDSYNEPDLSDPTFYEAMLAGDLK